MRGKRKNHDGPNKCFICSIEKDVFDKQAGGPKDLEVTLPEEAHNCESFYS